MITVSLIIIALGLDYCLGEPCRYHPLVGFGQLAEWLERLIYKDSRQLGIVAVLVLIIPPTFVGAYIQRFPLDMVFATLLLYLAIGWTSLTAHAQAVYQSLLTDDLPGARQRISLMVSRDTAELDEEGVVKATLESVLENGNDAIFAAIFWFALAGAPGVIVYRLANTLDAMWGYRNERYIHFGWFAARFDDVLNLIPARLTALGYSVVGNTGMALRCWSNQSARWKSPNAGPVMAAGAGSLGILLGGPADYHGISQQRPQLGDGRSPEISDIQNALILIRRTLAFYLLVLLAGGWVFDSIAKT